MSKAKKYHICWGVAAFISFISFFQINSYWADKHHFNGIFGWLGIGILFFLIGAYFLYKVIKNSNNTPQRH